MVVNLTKWTRSRRRRCWRSTKIPKEVDERLQLEKIRRARGGSQPDDPNGPDVAPQTRSLNYSSSSLLLLLADKWTTSYWEHLLLLAEFHLWMTGWMMRWMDSKRTSKNEEATDCLLLLLLLLFLTKRVHRKSPVERPLRPDRDVHEKESQMEE